MSLIKKSAGSHAAITAAIENMWHGKKRKYVYITALFRTLKSFSDCFTCTYHFYEDLPDGKAVGGLDEWNTTSKSKSKKVVNMSCLADYEVIVQRNQ